jgi:hypothetical protein
MAIKIERAPIHSMMGFAHPIGAEGSTRDAASPDHPLSLSLSTGDDVNDDDEKGRHVSSRRDGFCTERKHKGTVVVRELSPSSSSLKVPKKRKRKRP